MAFNLIKSGLAFGVRSRLSAELKHMEGRRARRRGHNDHAWIRFEDSFGMRDCQLLDISRSGFRLAIANADKLPDTFILLLSKNGTGYRARVKWRRGNQIGAEFEE